MKSSRNNFKEITNTRLFLLKKLDYSLSISIKRYLIYSLGAVGCSFENFIVVNFLAVKVNGSDVKPGICLVTPRCFNVHTSHGFKNFCLFTRATVLAESRITLRVDTRGNPPRVTNHNPNPNHDIGTSSNYHSLPRVHFSQSCSEQISDNDHLLFFFLFSILYHITANKRPPSINLLCRTWNSK